MKLAENIVYTLPSCDASIMKVVAKLIVDENRDLLLETGELNVELSMVSYIEESRSRERYLPGRLFNFEARKKNKSPILPARVTNVNSIQIG